MTERDPLPRIHEALRRAASRFGTPVQVTDQATLEASAARIQSAFPDPWLRAFSIKANDVAPIVARLGALGFDANVVSRGEWAVAHRAGIPNARITLEGVGKTDGDLRAAVRSAVDGDPIRWVAIESLDEAEVLVRIAGAPRSQARRGGDGRMPLGVLFRLNPEVAPETHAGLAVGSGPSKFGMTADELSAAVAVIEAAPRLRARGIQLHVGSQLGAVDAWRDAVRRGLALLALLGGTRPDFDTLDVGGGFPVAPLGEPAPDAARFAREVPALLDAIPADRRPRRFAIEPGRAPVARSGFLVARVLHVRERGGRLIVIDAGMTELIRPALYDAWHEIVALTSLGRPFDPVDPGGAGAGSDGAASMEPARVEGPICESTDHLGEHRLPPLRRGDLVAIRDTGAYSASMATTYNGRPRPAQVIVELDGSLALARRRGSLTALG
ncbi:MAG TPA: diaminopimelate decarboxylase [Candidatus Limnocylindrales bacterium]|nr:diaminopimelate decarboxylase [Candidatus Limnocylindrales bacterium]